MVTPSLLRIPSVADIVGSKGMRQSEAADVDIWSRTVNVQ